MTEPSTVIDPLWIRPLPAMGAILDSASHTKKLLVVDCGWPTYGWSAEIVAAVAEAPHMNLKAAARLGFAETVCPTAKSLEQLYYPNAETIAAQAYAMVTGKTMPAWTPHENGAAPEVATFRGPF